MTQLNIPSHFYVRVPIHEKKMNKAVCLTKTQKRKSSRNHLKVHLHYIKELEYILPILIIVDVSLF
jgi:hypothetical protein